ncbi:MAG: TniB family NTP-binding protein [Loktanella sp.]|nr:TniB family NTP-binding protein [Loktanella sp.]
MTTTMQLPRKEVRAIIKELRAKYIKMERDRAFLSTFDRLLECDEDGNLIAQPVAWTATGETRGIVVTDGAGGGKTSLVRHALNKHPALQPSDIAAMPCVSITVPSPATAKSVGREILKATTLPVKSVNRTAQDIWDDVAFRFKLLGTVVLWIDEAHDVFPQRSKSEAPAILKTLKTLMQGDSAVIVVLSGVDRLWQNVCFDDQVSRRYFPFALPQVSGAADCKRLWAILGGYCDRASLELPPRGDLIERLVHAGRHRFGRCVEQMIDAIEIALMRGDAQLDIQHFADAFFAQECCAISENVFLVPRWSSINLHSRAA